MEKTKNEMFEAMLERRDEMPWQKASKSVSHALYVITRPRKARQKP